MGDIEAAIRASIAAMRMPKKLPPPAYCDRCGEPSPREDMIIMYPGKLWCHGCMIKFAFR